MGLLHYINNEIAELPMKLELAGAVQHLLAADPLGDRLSPLVFDLLGGEYIDQREIGVEEFQFEESVFRFGPGELILALYEVVVPLLTHLLLIEVHQPILYGLHALFLFFLLFLELSLAHYHSYPGSHCYS